MREKIKKKIALAESFFVVLEVGAGGAGIRTVRLWVGIPAGTCGRNPADRGWIKGDGRGIVIP